MSTQPMLTKDEKEIILAYAKNDMNAQKTGRYLHHRKISYYFDRIHDKTGLDPRKFYGLVKLVKMAREITPEEE